MKTRSNSKNDNALIVWVVLFIAILSLNAVSASTSFNADSSSRLDRMLGAWALQWSDEFNAKSPSGINTNKWLYDTGTKYSWPNCPSNWGTGEVEQMSNSMSNVYQTGNGYLAIRPTLRQNGYWYSGRIETVSANFQPPTGGVMAVEARIQLPNVSGAQARGYWPAFWMLGKPFRGHCEKWPSAGEIDIMENINGQSVAYGTFHCDKSPGGKCNEPSGMGEFTAITAGFHVYRVELDQRTSPQQIRWYVDGVKFLTIKSSQFSAQVWSNATSHGFFIILDVAMGGNWAGNPTANTKSGAPMLIDYVRVYSINSAATPTPTVCGNC